MDWQKHKHHWPNAALSSFIHAPPHKWHVQAMGRGRSIVLLHGAGASTHTWAEIIPLLGQNHHVIAIDLPGQGFTKLGSRNRCGLEEMSHDIKSLLNHLEVSPDLIVGHSAGAAIALHLAADLEPQPAVVSINGAVENFNGVAGVLFPIFAKILALNPATGHLFSLVTANDARIKKLISSTGSTISEEQLGHYKSLVRDSGHVNATLSMMAQWNLETLPEKLRALRQKVIFITGSKDAAVPPEASSRAATLIKDAEVETIAHLGHLMHEEDPALLGERIAAFMETLEPVESRA